MSASEKRDSRHGRHWRNPANLPQHRLVRHLVNSKGSQGLFTVQLVSPRYLERKECPQRRVGQTRNRAMAPFDASLQLA